jgi:hypothetical protein
MNSSILLLHACKVVQVPRRTADVTERHLQADSSLGCALSFIRPPQLL